ncbi:hypothetical protein GY45DRAFT_1329382, partial [Cubamyces sp. BRFM 1775]
MRAGARLSNLAMFFLVPRHLRGSPAKLWRILWFSGYRKLLRHVRRCTRWAPCAIETRSITTVLLYSQSQAVSATHGPVSPDDVFCLNEANQVPVAPSSIHTRGLYASLYHYTRPARL